MSRGYRSWLTEASRRAFSEMPALFRPHFSSVSAATDLQVRRIGAASYPNVLSQIEKIEQFGGSEVNSNNFSLQAIGGRYLLKRLPGRLDPELLRRQLGLMAWLHAEKGINVPAVVRSSTSDILLSDSDFHWCLFEFMGGDFFNGGSGQLSSTAYEIGRLQCALSAHPRSLMPPSRWRYQTSDDHAVFEATIAGRKEWAEIFGSVIATELSASWDRVLRSDADLNEQRAQIERMPNDACHCDLHPHNILMSGDRPAAFIDFESFAWMPPSAALGFAVYKLVKQHAVSQMIKSNDRGRIAQAAETFFDGLQRGFGSSGMASGIDRNEMRLMATAEIFRRLLVVLRLNLRDDNAAWNHVLPMHLAGLEEIDLIFGSHVSAHR